MLSVVGFRLKDDLAVRICRVSDVLSARDNGGELLSQSAVLRRVVRAGLTAMERELGIETGAPAKDDPRPGRRPPR